MLQDCKNNDRPPVLKTFQRRAREVRPVNTPRALRRSPKMLQALPCNVTQHKLYGVTTPDADNLLRSSVERELAKLSEAARSAMGPPSMGGYMPRGKNVASDDNVGSRCPDGLLKTLKQRRTSVIMVDNNAERSRRVFGDWKENRLRIDMSLRVPELAAKFAEVCSPTLPGAIRLGPSNTPEYLPCP